MIVVDDGSTDGTARIAGAAGATVISLKNNRGKGAALREGWQWARHHGFEWALMLDGDGQHAAGDIPAFFEFAEAREAELVIGQREPGKIPLARRWVNRFLSWQISKLAGMKAPDSQCGFRLARLEALLNLRLTSEHFEIESEMLVALARAGRTVGFVPIQTIYRNGTSKIRPITDTIRWLRWRMAQSDAEAPEILLAPSAATKTSFAD